MKTVEKVCIDIEEYSKMILSFIGSEEYKRLLEVTNDTKESGFIHGLAISGILMQVKCNKYKYFTSVEDKEDVDG